MAIYFEQGPFTGTDGDRISVLTPTTGLALTELNDVFRVASNRAARGGDSPGTESRSITQVDIPTADYQIRQIIRATTFAGPTVDIGCEGRRNPTDNDDFVRLDAYETAIEMGVRTGADGGAALGSPYAWSPSIETEYEIIQRFAGATVAALLDSVEIIAPQAIAAHTLAKRACLWGYGATAGAAGWQCVSFIVEDTPGGGGGGPLAATVRRYRRNNLLSLV